jgi:hypothetical protein
MKIFLSAALELLGHVSISTTAVYTHMDFAYLAKVYRAAHTHAVIIRRPVGAHRPWSRGSSVYRTAAQCA